MATPGVLLIGHHPRILIRCPCNGCIPNHARRLSVAALHPRNAPKPLPSKSLYLRRRSPIMACGSETFEALPKDANVSDEARQWDLLTSQMTAASNIPFLVIQMPQIILNASNLMAGNKTALFAIPWLSMFTGLLGNVTLLSYFVKKRESGAIMVQTLGVVSIYVVLSQLTMAGAMPLNLFIATSVVVAIGMILPFLSLFGKLNASVWRLWEDAITVVGMAALPQSMWSTFIPYLPNTILPGVVSSAVAVMAVVMARTGKLPDRWVRFVGALSGWTATLLFMWMPISQLWTNFLNPDNIKGLSALTMLLAMAGNGLMIPRALFIKDFMWLTGCTWATLLYGYGNILCLYCFSCVSKEFFFSATFGLLAWLGMTLWRNSVAYSR